MVVVSVLSLAVLLGASVVSASGSGWMGIGWEMVGREVVMVVLGVERPAVRRMEPSLAARPERCFFGFNLNVISYAYMCVCFCE